MTYINEAQVEIVTAEDFRELRFQYRYIPIITPDGKAPERAGYAQVVLNRRLMDAMVRINPDEAIEDALRQVTRTDSPSLIVNNRAFHKMLIDGIDVSWRDDGQNTTAKSG